MPSIVNNAWVDWKASQDENGHITYTIVFLIQGEITDGPYTIINNTPGLPNFGDPWSYGNDVDTSAWCLWNVEVVPVTSKETNDLWTATYTFSNKPPDPNSRPCKDQKYDDPLTEPQRLSGSFVKYTREMNRDMNGFPITNSAHEVLRGETVTFDDNRPQVVIEQNVLDLQFDILASFRDTVNNQPLWGFPARCVKLSDVTWERLYYGNCYVYFKRKLTFDIDGGTFDRDVLDEGTKVLHGQWDETTGNWVLVDIAGHAPDPGNPAHFDQFKDRKGENTKVILNGAGLPSGSAVYDTYYVCINGGNADLEDEHQWAEVNDLTPFEWPENPIVGSLFDAGDIVIYGSGEEALYYVATHDTDSITGDPPDNPAHWTLIGPTLTFQGLWISGTDYATGDIVQATGEVGAGNIHVEYYGESDFTELGIPLDFNDISAYPAS